MTRTSPEGKSVAGHRADTQVVVKLLDARQGRDPVQVDQDSGLGEPKFHQGDETLPSRQRLHVEAVLFQQPRGLFQGGRGKEVECPRDHDQPPCHDAVGAN